MHGIQSLGVVADPCDPRSLGLDEQPASELERRVLRRARAVRDAIRRSSQAAQSLERGDETLGFDELPMTIEDQRGPLRDARLPGAKPRIVRDSCEEIVEDRDRVAGL